MSHESKRAARAELEQLVGTYLANGGTVTTNPEAGKHAQLMCKVCSAARLVPVRQARAWVLHCLRCGSPTRRV